MPPPAGQSSPTAPLHTPKVSPSEGHSAPSLPSELGGCKTFTLTSSKGKTLFGRRWEPPEGSSARGLVFLSHGFSEHLAWYDTLATALTDRGLLVFGHDHVGHGRSDGARGYVKDATEYSDDVLRHVSIMKEEHQDLPCYIVGHSMGGMITVSAVLGAPAGTFQGAVLMGPLILPDPNEATPFRIAAARVVARLFPFFPVSKLDEELVTSDKEMRHRMVKDELRYRGALRAQWACTCLDQVLQNKDSLDKFSVPFLILHGENDGLCAVSGSQLLYDTAPVKDKQFKVFPKALHNLYIERSDIRQEALTDTVEWIVQRLPQHKG